MPVIKGYATHFSVGPSPGWELGFKATYAADYELFVPHYFQDRTLDGIMPARYAGSMGYENAKATILAATNCVCCGKALVDSVSVEMGIGPVCRSKYMESDVATDDQRKEANALVYQAASSSTSNAQKLHLADQVAALGFPLFAEIVRKRFLKKVISVMAVPDIAFPDVTCTALIVQVPFASQSQPFKFNTELKKAIDYKDRKPIWNKPVQKGKQGVWMGWAVKCSPTIKRRLLTVLEKLYSGEEAIGPKGTFKIGG